MKKIIPIAITLVIVALVGFRLMSNKQIIDEKKQVKFADLRPAINVAKVESRISEKQLNLIGTASAIKELEVKSEVQGKVIELNVELGDFVRKGQTIARVDDKMRSLSLTNAEQRLADAIQNFERYKNLYEGGAATKAQYDQHKLALDNAEIQVAQAKKELSTAVVAAPISGIITQKPIEAGAFVTMGNPIATIVDVSSLKVKLNVPEKDVYALNVGDPVKISASVYPGVSYGGKIIFISPKGDDAHNYPVEIALSNNDQHPLKAGTYVNVNFNRKSESPSLQIPREALVGSVKNAKVYVVNDGIARLKSITVGAENGAYLEVLNGLNPEEIVVTTGQINLSDGASVNVIQ